MSVIGWDNHISEMKTIDKDTEAFNKELTFNMMSDTGFFTSELECYKTAKRIGDKNYIERMRKKYGF